MAPNELLRKVVGVLEQLGVRYLITGSVASSAYGEPRFTNDLDIVVDLPPGSVATFCGAFPASDYYLSEAAVRDAVVRHGCFNLIHPTSGLKVDFIMRQTGAFDDSRFTRSIRCRPTTDIEATFASAEDVILKKMEFYKLGGSEKHLRDITGVLKVSGERVDHHYIEKWALKLDVMEVWQAILRRLA